MAERYTRLYALPENQYTADAPVLIAAGALLKDNQTGKALAQIKFKSISEKQIKAVKVSVAAFDIAGKELEGVAEYQYLDLNVGRNAEFGQKQVVTLPDAVTRSFKVKCTDVFFADGSAWCAAPDAAWNMLPVQETVFDKLGSLAAQYQRDTSTRSKFIPAEHEDLWFCSCGALNHEGEDKCHTCKQDKAELFAALELEGLNQRNEEYKAAEAEKAAKQAEADKIQSAKNKKLALIAAAVIAVIIATSLLLTNISDRRWIKSQAAMMQQYDISDCFEFGSYEQDGDLNNGSEKIRWVVIAKEEGRILVISEKILAKKSYHNTDDCNETWENSPLREWLNNDFLNCAFTENEKKMILAATVPGTDDIEGAIKHDDTKDNLYLLSVVEFYEYLSTESLQNAKPTKYAGENISGWWLRDTGIYNGESYGCHFYNDYLGSSYIGGHVFLSMYGGSSGVRPAMWIDLNP